MKHLVIVLLTLLALPGWAQMFTSPNGDISFTVRSLKGELQYKLNYKEKEVMKWSPITFKYNDKLIGDQSSVRLLSNKDGVEAYQTFGNHTDVNLPYRSLTFRLKDKDAKSQTFYLDVKLFNTGVACRLRTTFKDETLILGDQFDWNLLGNPEVCYPIKHKRYEGEYIMESLTKVATGDEIICPPVTMHWKDEQVYMLLSEANLVDYSGMLLKRTNEGFASVLPRDAKGWKMTGEVISPWRVTVLTDDLNELMNCDLFTALCDAPSAALKSADWIKPGRSAWQWWAVDAPEFDDQHYWYDKAAELGFEYYLIDDGWRFWKQPGKDKWTLLKECIDYGKTKGVQSTIWVHSKYLKSPEEQTAFLKKVKDVGAVGIKIDFFPAESYKVVNWYERILKETAELELMVDFHGCNKPTGLNRTYPHEMTREGVRGQEWHISRFKRLLPPAHDVIIPFTRLAVGYGDYTPMVFNPYELFGNTWAKELAKPIIFTSPLTHYADYPMYYIGHPAEDIIKAIPTVWDETIVLPGSTLGETVIIARRSGDDWFVGAMNGDKEKELSLNLDFLGEGEYEAVLIRDHHKFTAQIKRHEQGVNAKSNVSFKMRKAGGFVAWIKKK
ncbi:hypothetical protein EYV94_07725 [Puteibacter caeruleilacunae]|nr:hypothetical protein EYV94_07725 [Puteibacter caeruleilacunae]